MQFSDPNAGMYGPNPLNGYAGDAGMPYMGMGQRQIRRRRGGCLGCLGVLVVLIVLISLLVHFVWNVTLSNGPTVIQVGPAPILIIHSDSGSDNPPLIHVHGGGSNGQMSVRTDHPLNLPFWFPVSYQEASDQQTVVLDIDPNVSGTIDVTVPVLSNLKIDSNAAPLLVEGVHGQMVLTTNSGALTVQNSTLDGPSLVRSNSSTLKMIQDHLKGSTSLDNNSGNIIFQGTVEPSGPYHFTENSGSLTVTLLPGTAAHIDVTALQGTITSNIPGAKIQPRSGAGGFELHTNAGEAPFAPLSLYNNSGTITVNE